MRSIKLQSPSKINLHLRVGRPDASGFHPLRSWFVTTDLTDALACTIAESPTRSVRLRCDDESIPTDGRNLVVRSAHAYLDAINARPLAVDFDLVKRVPAGAGLGGGSGNAATALVALDALLDAKADLPSIAATLGSDVPFFLGPPSAIATGRGERLASAPPPRACWALLIFPPFGISTPAAFARLDRDRPVAPAGALDPFDVDAWSRVDARALARHLINDLESPAFAIEPSLRTRRDAFERTLDRPVRMSGSGSTLFALFDDRDEAAFAAGLVHGATAIVRLAHATIASA